VAVSAVKALSACNAWLADVAELILPVTFPVKSPVNPVTAVIVLACRLPLTATNEPLSVIILSAK